jgi:hypothetical protein
MNEQAAYTIDAGDVRVIRPLLYTREKLLRDFSYGAVSVTITNVASKRYVILEYGPRAEGVPLPKD